MMTSTLNLKTRHGCQQRLVAMNTSRTHHFSSSSSSNINNSRAILLLSCTKSSNIRHYIGRTQTRMTFERKRRGSSSLCKAFSFMGEHNQDNNINNKNMEVSSSGVLSTKELVQDNINNNNNNGNSVVTPVEYPRHDNNYAESSDRMNNDTTTNNDNSVDGIMTTMQNTSVFEEEDVCSGKIKDSLN